MKKSSKFLALGSLVISAPVLAEGSHFVTAGMGMTDYELVRDGDSFTEADWNDIEFGYTYRSDSGFFFNAKYRTPLSAEHDTFSDGTTGDRFTTDLEDSRVSLTAGLGMFYLGWLSYDTTLVAPAEFNDNPGDIDYSLSGLTIGLQHSIPIGDSSHRLSGGVGGLIAEAEVTQTQTPNDYKAEYDYTFGYFFGVGIGGPISTTGLIYSFQYEYQTIEFDSYYSDTFGGDYPVLEDTRSRLSASLTYLF